MRLTQIYYVNCCILSYSFATLTVPVFGQLGIALDIKKPKEYENRVLAVGKIRPEEIQPPKRFIQNTLHITIIFLMPIIN